MAAWYGPFENFLILGEIWGLRWHYEECRNLGLSPCRNVGKFQTYCSTVSHSRLVFFLNMCQKTLCRVVVCALCCEVSGCRKILIWCRHVTTNTLVFSYVWIQYMFCDWNRTLYSHIILVYFLFFIFFFLFLSYWSCEFQIYGKGC